MEIGSVTAASAYQPTAQSSGQEVSERGPDNDGDADDQSTASVAASSGPQPNDPLQGQNINILA